MLQAQGRLSGKVAVVTGGTQGIGQGIVLRFLKEGASVVYCSRNPANNAENAALIADIPGGKARASYVQADVGNKSQMVSLINGAVDQFGRLDIVINNAQGIAPVRPIEEKPDANYEMTIRTGFYQSLWTSQAALPHMKQVGGGRIVNFSSHWALWGQMYGSDYSVTKAANEAFTRCCAQEWGRFNITVNCILPSGDSYAYKVYKEANPELCERIEKASPIRRIGHCEHDVAAAVLGLVSRNGRFINGLTLPVDGGNWAAIPPGDHAIGTDIHEGRHQENVVTKVGVQ